MHGKPQYIDPRKAPFTKSVIRQIEKATPHAQQSEIIDILNQGRNVETLEKLVRIFPPRKGLLYDAESIARRARRRIVDAVKAARRYAAVEPSIVLEIGCARAENALLVQEAGATKYLGLDIDDTHFPAVQSLGIDARLIKASAEEIPLPDNSIDMAISFNVFEHIPTPGNALREIVRVLRPGGVFYTKFGPPFNSAAGPHLTRFIDLPYMHHLLPERVVGSFVGRKDAYYTVNKKPLSYYREIFFNENQFTLKLYREQIDERGFWLLRAMPDLTGRLSVDELVVNSITALVEKID